jgi:hypothetical protein
MASKEVLFSTCDRCFKEAQTDIPQGPRKDTETLLPDNWIHISGRSKRTSVFEMDLCDDCKGIVIAAAGRGDKASLS